MSSDDQFTALGPAAVGFQTNGSNIDVGAAVAGTKAGVQAECIAGPGVETSGKLGIIAEGRNGQGGEFASPDLRAQIRLRAHDIGTIGSALMTANPREYEDPKNSLPEFGELGDLLLLQHDGLASLWLCVVGFEKAKQSATWSQVLLGRGIDGFAT